MSQIVILIAYLIMLRKLRPLAQKYPERFFSWSPHAADVSTYKGRFILVLWVCFLFFGFILHVNPIYADFGEAIISILVLALLGIAICDVCSVFKIDVPENKTITQETIPNFSNEVVHLRDKLVVSEKKCEDLGASNLRLQSSLTSTDKLFSDLKDRHKKLEASHESLIKLTQDLRTQLASSDPRSLAELNYAELDQRRDHFQEQIAKIDELKRNLLSKGKA